MTQEKPIAWIGSSYKDLLAFPDEAKRLVGYQLYRVQIGLNPEDWKPFHTVGSGVKEIRIRDASGIYRVIYVAKFEDAVYVLHTFQKKSQKTSKRDVDIAKARYRAVVAQHSKGVQ